MKGTRKKISHVSRQMSIPRPEVRRLANDRILARLPLTFRRFRGYLRLFQNTYFHKVANRDVQQIERHRLVLHDRIAGPAGADRQHAPARSRAAERASPRPAPAGRPFARTRGRNQPPRPQRLSHPRCRGRTQVLAERPHARARRSPRPIGPPSGQIWPARSHRNLRDNNHPALAGNLLSAGA